MTLPSEEAKLARNKASAERADALAHLKLEREARAEKKQKDNERRKKIGTEAYKAEKAKKDADRLALSRKIEQEKLDNDERKEYFREYRHKVEVIHQQQ